jgi:hypothetical protein
MIPTGNLNTSDVEIFNFIVNGDSLIWRSVLPRVTMLTTQWFIEQRIADLPQPCGLNCLYTVSVPSFVFKCQPNPASLPDGQMGESSGVASSTLWNATVDPNSMWAFYVAWQNFEDQGTMRSAYCSPVLAQYDVEVGKIVLFLQSHR